MIDFNTLKEVVIPEGVVVEIANGSTVLWKRPGLVPSAYQQVQYIQTNGNQYINTGVMASDYQDGLEYVFVGNATAKSSKPYDYLFGCLASSKRSGNVACVGGNSVRILIGGSGAEIFTISDISLNTDFTLRAKGTSKAISDFTASYNDVSLTSTSNTPSNCNMPSANIYLLASNINGNYYSSTSAPFTGILYSFTMADMSGTPIRNFIPCYRKSDNEIGLYDTVGRRFYTNAGCGSFTKGANV